MPKPTKLTHYCQACQTKHTFIENQFPFWKSKEHNGETLYWCNKGIDCAGCKTIHPKTGITKGLEHPSGKTIWLCNKWFKRYGTGDIDWDIWSPQEVMSGVHLGEERDAAYGADSENHSIVQGEQVQNMTQALDELEELEELDGRWK